MYSSSTTSSSDYSNPVGGIMRPLVMDRGAAKWKYGGAAEIAPSCPRCASANTKFCYYNNYSLSQPRYFCKACRRYWTKGGSLRNVPVGGGCRKTRRARAAASRHPSAAAVADNSAAAAAIDMAAVFAKYVNQSSSSNDDDSLSPGSSSEHAPASALDDVYHTPLGLIGDDQMQQVMPQMSTCQDVTGQFLYQDCSNNGFDQLQQQEQGVLCEDILWAEGTTLQNFAYAQPMVQVEDCGLFAPDHDSNLVSDNWSSFDLSAYDFYSTP